MKQTKKKNVEVNVFQMFGYSDILQNILFCVQLKKENVPIFVLGVPRNSLTCMQG